VLATVTSIALIALGVAGVAEAKRSVYVSHFGSTDVSGFDVGADRSLTPIAGSPFASGVTGGRGPS
jgi:hypothetical protein